MCGACYMYVLPACLSACMSVCLSACLMVAGRQDMIYNVHCI